MSYEYEALLDEHFQMLCQSLLLLEYPQTQCLSVGMPDGGRDAVAFETSDLTIFQVKFARDFRAIPDPVEWVKAAINGEVEKVERLKARGATRYALVTNMPGTPHLDVGRVDKIQKHMNEVLALPSFCMWREDLDRRLDTQFDLKLRYPGLLNGPDVVRLLWQQAAQLVPADAKRVLAVDAYLADQYQADATVRFKQAELLPSPLLDLYVDVPVALPTRGRRLEGGAAQAFKEAASRSMKLALDASEPRIMIDDNQPERIYSAADGVPLISVGDGVYSPAQIGASELLLDASFGAAAPLVVLEGAPGQGKSTLAQYLAQVHRARLLGKHETVSELAEGHRNSPVRLPLKLELRDIAAWLRGVDPWAGPDGPVHSEATTLEAAIAAHVRRFSGGAAFDVSDFHALVVGSTPLLILLDALDEVADVGERRGVVDEVVAATGRLVQLAPDISILITSRPTAIANAPVFPKQTFQYLSLGAITPRLALDYTRRWSQVRKLDASDEQELARLLKAKLAEPHMQDLAKNTMQLSILLSLLHLRGASLPDKRTELYDTYVEVFLNRESEKSDVVKDNRELLVDIHRYLGFHLHATAESGKNQGRISTDDLRALLVGYLNSEGHAIDLVDSLLAGVVERVVALVSRVEGTYEFEVQPLREYFAGRHLYDTAPYSPTGREQPGTKPDRFDAVAGNSYWLNTTRFFAGCFSKGELADLADRLGELTRRKDMQHIAYPRTLAGALLQDLVFTQSPRATEQVVAESFDDLGLRWAALEDSPIQADVFSRGRLRLTTFTGGRELAVHVRARLLEDGVTERAHQLAELLVLNEPADDRLAWWLAEWHQRAGSARLTWLRIGHWLAILPLVDLELLIPADAVSAHERAEMLAILSRADVIPDDSPDDLIRDCVRSILGRCANRLVGPKHARTTWIGLFDQAVHAPFTSQMLYDHDFSPFRPRRSDLSMPSLGWAADVAATVGVLDEAFHADLAVSAKPWRSLVGALEALSAGSLVATEFAVVSAAIKSSTERGAGASDMLDPSHALPDRMRYARRRGRQSAWWAETAGRISSPNEAALWVLAACAWCDAAAVSELVASVNLVSDLVSPLLLNPLATSCGRSPQYSQKARQLLPGDLTDLSLSSRRLFLRRLPSDLRSVTARELLEAPTLSPVSATQAFEVLEDELQRDPAQLVATLPLIEKAHEAGGVMTIRDHRLLRWLSSKAGADATDAVLSRPWNVPGDLLSMSEAACSRRAPRPASVASLAVKQGWWT